MCSLRKPSVDRSKLRTVSHMLYANRHVISRVRVFSQVVAAFAVVEGRETLRIAAAAAAAAQAGEYGVNLTCTISGL